MTTFEPGAGTPPGQRVVFVGAGPKALAVAERLIAHRRAQAGASSHPAEAGAAGAGVLELLFVDPHDPGAGRVWDTGQSPVLLNNTPASGTTVFADDSTGSAAPLSSAPSLADWCADPSSHSALPYRVRQAAALIRPWSAPPRALQGWYYRWAFEHLRFEGADTARLVHRAATVESLRRLDGARRMLHLAEDRGRALEETSDGSRDGSRDGQAGAGRAIVADAVVLTTGFVDDEPDDAERVLARQARRHGARYKSPGMMRAESLDGIAWPGGVLVRGLGATFFDLLGLAGHEGRLRPARRSEGAVLVAGSGAGLPKRSQPGGPGPRPEPRMLTGERFGALHERHSGRGTLEFTTTLQPLVVAELDAVFAAHPVAASLDDGLEPLRSLTRPVPDGCFTAAQWQRVVERFAAQERFSLEHPERSPWPAGRAVLFAARRGILSLLRAGAFADEAVVHGFVAAIGRVTSGPPAERMAVLIEALDAGRVRLLGPAARFGWAGEGFSGHSDRVDAPAVAGATLIEAWQRFGSATRSRDTLVRALLDDGAAVDAAHDAFVTDDDGVLLTASGRRDDGLWMLGHLARARQRGVNQGAVPGSADPFLIEADAAALSIVRHLAAGASGAGVASGNTAAAPAGMRQS